MLDSGATPHFGSTVSAVANRVDRRRRRDRRAHDVRRVLTTNSVEESARARRRGRATRGGKPRRPPVEVATVIAGCGRDGARAVRGGGAARAMKRSARRAREAALQILYQWDVGRGDVDRAVETFVAQWPDAHPAPEDVQAFGVGLARDTVAGLPAIDALVAETGQDWRPERMAVLDRLILRLAVCELMRDVDTPPAVSSNEAFGAGQDVQHRGRGEVHQRHARRDQEAAQDTHMTSLDEQLQQRRANLDELVKLGVDVYPRRFDRTHTITALAGTYSERSHDELEAERIETTTSGGFSASDRSARRTSSCCRTGWRRSRCTSARTRCRRSISRPSSFSISATESGHRALFRTRPTN